MREYKPGDLVVPIKPKTKSEQMKWPTWTVYMDEFEGTVLQVICPVFEATGNKREAKYACAAPQKSSFHYRASWLRPANKSEILEYYLDQATLGRKNEKV